MLLTFVQTFDKTKGRGKLLESSKKKGLTALLNSNTNAHKHC